MTQCVGHSNAGSTIILSICQHFEFQEEEFPQLSNPIKVGVIYLEIFIVGAKNSMLISDLTLNCNPIVTFSITCQQKKVEQVYIKIK
jgi:hypothetical protein